MPRGKTYIVEHLDPELGPWSELEYQAIAEETDFNGGQFCLSSLPPAFKVPTALQAVPGFIAEMRGVEDLYMGEDRKRVCLLDPSAEHDLTPEDAQRFDVFLFGGILGECARGRRRRLRLRARVCIQGRGAHDQGGMLRSLLRARVHAQALRRRADYDAMTGRG
jgi:ribosome biogenesis SPOUT family RNA methylase Rps3